MIALRTLVRFAWRTTLGAAGPRSAMLLRRAPVRLWTAMFTLLAECQGATDQKQSASYGRADFEYGRHSVSPLNCVEGLVRQSPTLASQSVKACFAHAASVGP